MTIFNYAVQETAVTAAAAAEAAVTFTCVCVHMYIL